MKRQLLVIFLMFSLWLGLRIAFDVDGAAGSGAVLAAAILLAGWLDINAAIKVVNYREHRFYWRICAENGVSRFIT
ncbi:MAG: hypothetical protein KC419_01505 [Anaerolineales bacterium]|nr:hypothetical protein [Anaerolineales bacterium]